MCMGGLISALATLCLQASSTCNDTEGGVGRLRERGTAVTRTNIATDAGEIPGAQSRPPSLTSKDDTTLTPCTRRVTAPERATT